MDQREVLDPISGIPVEDDVVVLLSALAMTIQGIDGMPVEERTTKSLLDLMEETVRLTIDLKPDAHGVRIRSLAHHMRLIAEKRTSDEGRLII